MDIDWREPAPRIYAGLAELQARINRDIFKAAWMHHALPMHIHHDATPRRNPMPNYIDQYNYFHAQPSPHPLSDALRYFTSEINTQFREAQKTPEQKFHDLGIQPGDRVRLTQLNGKLDAASRSRQPAQDAAVLEGKVLGIKTRGGKSELRIAGFDHTGGKAGGQHVWFPVADYRIEVLHKVYRWTDEDRLIAELIPISEKGWEQLTDQQRATYRVNFGKRAEKIRKLLQSEGR